MFVNWWEYHYGIIKFTGEALRMPLARNHIHSLRNVASWYYNILVSLNTNEISVHKHTFHFLLDFLTVLH